MKDIVQKLKQASGPMALGWLLTVWLPVPASVRAVAATAANAVVSGAHAIVDSVQHPRRPQETAQR